MQFVNIHDAKTNLSKYLEQIISTDETIVICKNGNPIAQITAYNKITNRRLGLWHGQIAVQPDFDELPPDFKGHFE